MLLSTLLLVAFILAAGYDALFLAGVWLSLAYFLQSLINFLVWDGMVAHALGRPAPRLLKTITGIVLYAIALTGVVGYVLDKSVAGIWTTGGIIGIVIGLALQSMIRDVFVGLAVNFDRPFRIGDWVRIQVSGSQALNGQVQQVNWRTTRLLSSSGKAVIVPNSIIGSSVITNFCEPESPGEWELHLTLDYAVPIEQARRVLLAGVSAVLGEKGLSAQPPPQVRVNAITPLGIEYRLIYSITRGPGGARDKVLTSVIAHLHRAGLSLAIPKQDVFQAEMPERHLDASALSDRAKLLSRVELFAELPEKDREEIAARMKPRAFKAGDILFTEGEPADDSTGMFLLFEGLLEAAVRAPEKAAGVQVGQIVPGEFIGEMSVLTGEPRAATVTAVTDARVYEILPETFAQLLQNNPAAMSLLSHTCALRRVRTQNTLDGAAAAAATARVASLTQQILDGMKAFFSRSAAGSKSL